MKAFQVFKQNDGEVTKAYYTEMCRKGPLGEIAVALFRAQKRSTAAKRYRGRYRHAAYDVKNWSLSEIVRLLTLHKDSGITFGWKRDPNTPGFEWVLYVDLPTGQVSFHSPIRLDGPDYNGEWDEAHSSAERILSFCDSIGEQVVQSRQVTLV